MKVRSNRTKELGHARRCLALVALALFGHALALHAFHGYAVAARDHAPSLAATLSGPQDAPAGGAHSSDDCPACQLQHSFAFLDTTPAFLCPNAAAHVGSQIAAPRAAQRIAGRSAPSRAPPAV